MISAHFNTDTDTTPDKESTKLILEIHKVTRTNSDGTTDYFYTLGDANGGWDYLSNDELDSILLKEYSIKTLTIDD